MSYFDSELKVSACFIGDEYCLSPAKVRDSAGLICTNVNLKPLACCDYCGERVCLRCASVTDDDRFICDNCIDLS